MEDEVSSQGSEMAAMLQHALELSENRDFPAAILLLNQTLATDSANVDALVARGNVRRQCDELESAIDDFSRAVSLRHDLHLAYFERAETYAEMASVELRRGTGGPDSDYLRLALRDYSTAFRIQPEAEYLMARAACNEMAQLWVDALADYDRVLAVSRPADPHHDDAVKGKQRVAARVAETELAPTPSAPDAGRSAVSHAALLQARKEALQSYGNEVSSGLPPKINAPSAQRPPEANEAWSIARRIVDTFLNGEPVEYVPVNVQSFSDVDVDRYESITAQLLTLGFQILGDFEPLHMTRRFGTRVLARLIVDQRARTLVCVRQRIPLQLDSAKSWAARLLARPSARTMLVEFESEMADGRFIVTSNDKGNDTLSPPPQVDLLRMVGATAESDLWQVHAERVRSYKAAHSPMTDVSVRSQRQAFDLQERRRLVTMDFRTASGGLSGDELKNVLGSRYASLGAAVRSEISDMLASMKNQVRTR